MSIAHKNKFKKERKNDRLKVQNKYQDIQLGSPVYLQGNNRQHEINYHYLLFIVKMANLFVFLWLDQCWAIVKYYSYCNCLENYCIVCISQGWNGPNIPWIRKRYCIRLEKGFVCCFEWKMKFIFSLIAKGCIQSRYDDLNQLNVFNWIDQMHVWWNCVFGDLLCSSPYFNLNGFRRCALKKMFKIFSNGGLITESSVLKLFHNLARISDESIKYHSKTTKDNIFLRKIIFIIFRIDA